MSFVVVKGPYSVWEDATIFHADADGVVQECKVAFRFSIPTDAEFEEEFPDRAALLGAISAGGDEAASDRSAIDALGAMDTARAQTLERIIERTTDWRGFADEDGADLPFTRETFAALMGLRHFSDAVADAFDAARHGRREKN